jgi:dTMP kinase
LVDSAQGLFITFEGGEGTGKSTQIRKAAASFEKRGIKCLATREPGGTLEAEQLRHVLVNGETGRWSAEAEALLNYAARDSHLRDAIRPALARGEFVLCDRFMDSTRAYQGYAGECSLTFIDQLEQAIVGETRPHLTLIFDLDPALGLERARQRGDGMEDRFERKGLAFHQRLRAGFLAIAKNEPARCKVIDAKGSVEEVAAQVEAALNAALHGRHSN